MKYETLSKEYYKNREKYERLYNKRFEDADTIKLKVHIGEYEAFYVPCIEVYDKINRILREDKKVAIAKEKLPLVAINQFRMTSLIDEIIITNNIEGVHSTRREIKDVIEDINAKTPKKKRFSGLVNQYVLLGQAQLDTNTCEDIRAIYDKLVLAEVIEADKNNAPDGEIFRKGHVNVISPTQEIIHEGIGSEKKIIEYMQQALDVLNNEDIEILVRTAIFHYLFGYIHPFYDGNGRLSRFISSYFLAQDLDPIIGNRLSYTIQENIAEYYKAFKVCNDEKNRGDVTPFVIAFLDIIEEAVINLRIALEKRCNSYESGMMKIIKLENEEHLDKTVVYLSLALLRGKLFTKTGLTKKELMKELEIKSNQTLMARMKILKNYDLIIEKKEGNLIHYSLDNEKL